METKSIVLLANSYKPGGRCVAGKEVFLLDNGKWRLTDNWIRPVTNSAANNGSISSRHHLINHRDIILLDIVTIEFQAHTPDQGQPENWLIDESKQWTKAGHFKGSVIERLTDTPADLWVDTNPGIQVHEVGLAYEQAGNIHSSLELIKPTNFQIHLSNDYNPFQNKHKKESKVSFTYNGRNYNGISMTDTVMRGQLNAQYPSPDDAHVIATLPKGQDDYHICVSLSPIFEKTNKHYKLVAAVI